MTQNSANYARKKHDFGCQEKLPIFAENTKI
jgi:hypothetical protein